ncbi:MAG: N-acyl-D-glucosamine 2-epimerase [Magnetococcales bacterium]|nr:N-acyl-D-glucosamine 2-epimerase [Magnetococcales bacterium]MBF0182431.1 N-acyl-D-glucosamine 2-epimerase [Magnetococcales bacterium]
MKAFHTSMTLTGEVAWRSVSKDSARFGLKLLTDEVLEILISKTTYYEVLRNVGDAWRDRVVEPDSGEVNKALGNRDESGDPEQWDAGYKAIKYLREGTMICMLGVTSLDGEKIVHGARRVVLMHSRPNHYSWEETHWWLQQINTLAEQWLDVLFRDRRELTENDFSEFYRTNVDLLGGVTANTTQESATLSRFLYGLSSAYLLTGNQRALSAATACAHFLVNAFSSPSHDGEYIFWKFGRVKDGRSTKEVIGSLNGDDQGSFALYEQIYALAGLTQYYRVTQDTAILSYITRTMATFQTFYLDVKREGDSAYTGKGGYFSHLDPVTLRPDSPSLKFGDNDNRAKKNWNSIGDHIPAYLINLLVSIDPLPKTSDQSRFWKDLRDLCRHMLDDCVINILDHFDPDVDGSRFVNERFDKDWNPDHSWGWQKDRGIVGHNLKISWNLTRCAHYFISRAAEATREEHESTAQKYNNLANRCYAFARKLGNNMREVGVDLIRGGIFDALERHPTNGMGTEFAWGSTKDFWQQEQAVLAYYIMHGIDGGEGGQDYLRLARFMSAFWNLFFIDQDNRKIYFRTNEEGDPVIEGQYGIQGGHAIAGYHAFELNYLAHIYIRTFVDREDAYTENFVLYYRPVRTNGISTLNVMPDFFRPGDLMIAGIQIDGVDRKVEDPHKFQIDISDIREDKVILVEYKPIRGGRLNAPG